MEKPRKAPEVYFSIWDATAEPHWLEDHVSPEEGGIITLLLPESDSCDQTQMRQWVATEIAVNLDGKPLPYKRCDVHVSEIDGGVRISLYRDAKLPSAIMEDGHE